MKRLIALWCVLLVCGVARGTDVEFSYGDFSQAKQIARPLMVFPLLVAATNSAGITTGDRIARITGRDGSVTVTNLMPGWIRGDFHGLWRVSTNYFLIPNTNGLVRAADCLQTNLLFGGALPFQSPWYLKTELLPGSNTTFRVSGGKTYMDTHASGTAGAMTNSQPDVTFAPPFHVGGTLSIIQDQGQSEARVVFGGPWPLESLSGFSGGGSELYDIGSNSFDAGTKAQLALAGAVARYATNAPDGGGIASTNMVNGAISQIVPAVSYEGNIVATPPSIMLDCDVGTDIGDNSAAGMVIVAHMQGLCNLEAMTCCVAPGWISNGVPLLAVPYNQVGNMTQVGGAGFLEQLCQYHGVYPPFGFGNETNFANYGAMWSDPMATTIQQQNCGAVSNSFFPLRYATNYPVAYKVMRKVLASRKAVTILTLGQMNNYAKLLASAADEISPLTGVQMVSNNVSRVICMLGQYPTGVEYNISTLPRPAEYSVTNTPSNVPMIFSGWELGQNPVAQGGGFRIFDLCPPWLSYLNTTNPTYMVFTNSAWVGQGRAAWDSIAALYAICNVKTNSWFNRVQGRNDVDSHYAGSNNFVAGIGPTFNHYYLTIPTNMDRAVEAQLNSIGISQPSPFLNMRMNASNTPAAGNALRWNGTNRWYFAP